MPTCIFILSRFTLRVDNVLFRTHDTRMYHSFTSKPPLIVRETSGWEAPYERIKWVITLLLIPVDRADHLLPRLHDHQQLPKRDDLTPLTDPTFIAKILSEMPSHASQKEGAKTGWRGLGTKREIAILT
jgi:type 2A phosphatase activator TIP41